jgi:enolase-phosphatase E1
MKQHLLLDIEGTTCPVNFVSEVLFPFAKRELSTYLHKNRQNGNQNQTIQKAKKEWAEDQSVKSVQLKRQADLQQISEADALTQYLEHLIVIDKKSTALKDIQGQIWELGYSNGELKAELFPETVECLQQWHRQGITLSVYSSGSIHAQKLLYRNTLEGNCETLFSHWFDTHTGPKKASQSYSTIANQLNSSPENIWFVSDNGEECDAARKAGLKTLFSLRDGNPDQDPRDHKVIQSLREVGRHLATEK